VEGYVRRNLEKMKVLFIQENALSESLGLCSLSACLKQSGHECDLLLASHAKNLYGAVAAYRPDLIGFTVFTGMHKSLFSLIRELKRQFKVPVVLGGPHPTFYPHECFEECHEIDMVCRGEGEQALLGLVNALRDGTDYTNIPGLWVRKDGRVVDNSIALLNVDVDRLPLPDRSLYFKYDFIRDFPLKRFISGYGCPYRCSYCNQPFFENEYKREYNVGKSSFVRNKSVNKVIEEILQVRRTAAMTRVHFSDDLFAISRKWLREFAEKYPCEVGIPFSCNMRFDLIDEEMAALLRKANCFAVASGIESGNDFLRNKVVGKKLSNEQIIRGASLLHRRGIKVLTSNIVALPGETLENALETLRLNQKIKADYVRMNTLIPFPKTEITNYAIEHGYLPKGFSLKNITISDPTHAHCKTDAENEFKNLCSLVVLLVKFPFLNRFIYSILRFKHNGLIRALGILNVFQEIIFFRTNLIQVIRFYLNTSRTKNSDIGCNEDVVVYNRTYWMSRPPKNS